MIGRTVAKWRDGDDSPRCSEKGEKRRNTWARVGSSVHAGTWRFRRKGTKCLAASGGDTIRKKRVRLRNETLGVALRIGRMLPSWRWRENGILVVTKPRRCRDTTLLRIKQFGVSLFFFFSCEESTFTKVHRFSVDRGGRGSRLKFSDSIEKSFRRVGKQFAASLPS